MLLKKLSLSTLLCCLFFISKADSPPNIVFILADDWGWTDWQMNGDINGSTFYETPHLDKLAQEGVYFTQAYVHPLCSPTRAALMSGKYPGARLHMHQAITRHSVAQPKLPAKASAGKKTCFPQSRNHFPLSEITLPEELKKAGYQTHHFGKWHLGNKNYYPTQQGFDSQFAVGGAGPGKGGYFAPYAGIDDISQGPDGEYIAERLSNEVCQKLEDLQNEKFFIYLAHFNVHSPYQGKADLIKKYSSKIDSNNKHQHPTMAAMIESLDNSVGQVMAKIETLGLSDNTMIIVMGDNGGIHWANDKNYPHTRITCNAPLRAGKSCFYEGGVRVPLLIKYPPLTEAGRRENTPVHIVDFFPTLLSLAQWDISTEKDKYDGVNIIPLIANTAKIEQRPIYCHFPRTQQIGAPVGGSYIRYGDYKLCRLYGRNNDGTDAYELYNIEKDPGEQRDSSVLLPLVSEELKQMLDQWLTETGALVPHINPDWDKHTN